MRISTLISTLFASTALAAFGYTDQGTYWTIDTGGKLVVEVSQTNGDITSMKYNVSCAYPSPDWMYGSPED